jgi:hypothetical protein
MFLTWVLVISTFTPGGDLVSEYKEGPFQSKKECIASKKELNNPPALMGLKFKGKCVRLKVENENE